MSHFVPVGYRQIPECSVSEVQDVYKENLKIYKCASTIYLLQLSLFTIDTLVFPMAFVDTLIFSMAFDVITMVYM